MNNPLRRRRHDRDTADALRRTLDRHASDASRPDGVAGPARSDALAERVIAAAQRGETSPGAARQVPRRRRSARTAPILAAAAVLALIVGVVTAVALHGNGGERQEADRTPTVSAPTSASPTPTTSAPTVVPPTSTPPPTVAPAGSAARIVSTSKLTNVTIQDATFTGADAGWALASASCIRTTGRCTALLRTTDGKVWRSHPNTPFNVPGVNGCAAPCVDHIRFATDDIGYAFGPSALFMTVDGAQHWQPLAGGADALETLDGNVIAVGSGAGCPPGCTYTVRTAAIGSRHFTTVRLPGGQGGGDAVSLTRTGSAAYLLAIGNLADGASAPVSVLWTSADDGARWTRRGEVCAQRGGNVDSEAVTSAADGSATVLCRMRQSGRQFVTTTTDRGATFTAGPTVLGSAQAAGFGAASRSTVLVSLGDTFRSTDSGQHFDRLGADAGSTPGNPSFIGFASDTVGHAISGGSTIWTTQDAGRTWSAVHFD